MTDTHDAAAALDALGAARADLAARYDYPLSRHLAFAALTGTMVAAQAFPIPLNVIGDGLVVVAAMLIKRWDLRRTGSFLNGWRRGATRLATVVVLALVLGLTLAMLAAGPDAPTWQRAALVLAAAVTGLAGSYWWQAIYLADLRRGRRT